MAGAESGQGGGTPQGELTIQTVAMPADTNPSGDIFGGWVLAQMDIAGGIAARHQCGGRCATIAVESMTFQQPVKVGDVVCCYAILERQGRTSMTYRIETWAIRHEDFAREKVTEGVFTYVAIGGDGRPRPVSPDIVEA